MSKSDSSDKISKLIQGLDHLKKPEITYREEDWLKLKHRLDRIGPGTSPIKLLAESENVDIFLIKIPLT